MRLEGKVALVTGFNSGIGEEVAKLFTAEGAKVVGVARRAEAGEQTLAAIKANGGEAMFISADVRSEDEVDSAFQAAVVAYGGVDIVVNSAGIRMTGSVTQLTEQQWNDVLDTNLKGTFLVNRAAVTLMRGRGGGAIVNVSAISGFQGPSNRVAYGASKAGVHSLTESMALDHAADNIRVNCIAPGPTDTPMTNITTDEQRTLMATGIPLGRVGEATDLAQAALFLVSDAAKHITGAILPVTGGRHLIAG